MDGSHRFQASPLAMLRGLWRNRQLIRQMIRREVVGRYRGSVMGLAWSFFNPVLMLLVYTFVFSVVFKARWGTGGDESRADFAILLFIGMIVHGLFAECVNRAPTLIVGNVNFVKKVVFPLEALPWVAMGSSLFHSLVSVLVLVVALLLAHGALPWTAVFFPFVLLPLVLGTVGLALALASLGVYLRDIGQMTGIVTTVMMFLSPVFYPMSILPERFQSILLVNPLTFVIEEGRKVVFFGQLPDFGGWAVAMGIALVALSAGFWWFQRTRRGFADVL